MLAFCAVVAALTAAVWRYEYEQGLDQLAARGRADLALAGDRLVGQLQRYRDMAVILADHPAVVATLSAGGGPDPAPVLLETADKTAALDVLVVDTSARLRASALPRDQSVPVQDKPFLRRAFRGALGWGHGDGAPLTSRAFYNAAPVFGAGGRVLGAVVVMTDLNGIDYNWRGTNPAAFFTDRGGNVWVANRSELLFHDSAPGAVQPVGPLPPYGAVRVGGHEIWQLDWGPYLPREALHLTQELPVIGLRGEVLLDVAPARRLAAAQAAAVAALCLAFGSLLFLAAERRRALAGINSRLEDRVAQRTADLRESNTKLRAEAAERAEAEAALRRAQDDLVQAGKLSALGQMSAGISHELNQPLMAIRSFAENAVQFMERDKPDRAAENLARISDMARRMGRIIQNLRAFARQDLSTQDHVDLALALHTAVELTRAHVQDAGVTLDYAPPAQPIWVRGGEVRLSQVFVNLITNAVDAMAQTPEKRLKIELVQGAQIEVTFRDTGPGIEMPDKVFDPFYTTKAQGDTAGMGLGLSISYGIVQSFGGQIKGSNHTDGAVFTVTLEPQHVQEAAT